MTTHLPYNLNLLRYSLFIYIQDINMFEFFDLRSKKLSTFGWQDAIHKELGVLIGASSAIDVLATIEYSV